MRINLKSEYQFCHIDISQRGKYLKLYITTFIINHLRARHDKEYKYKQKKKRLKKNKLPKLYFVLTNQTSKQ